MARGPITREDVHGGGGPITVRRRSAGDLAPRGRHVTHQFAALAFYTAGVSSIEQRGRWRLEAGDVFVVPPGEPHRALEADGVEFWGVGLCVPCLPAHAASHLLPPFERVRAGGSAVVRIPEPRRSYLARLFEELQAAVGDASVPGSLPVQHGLLTLIVNEVEQAARAEAVAPQPPGLAAEALAVIERRCLGPLSLADVAHVVGRSGAYVTTAVTRATGRSVGAWITAFRMAEARRLLLHADMPVEDVAARVGYADATHFIRMFRREHGATPAVWREKARLSRRRR